jgi:hypothetical protein
MGWLAQGTQAQGLRWPPFSAILSSKSQVAHGISSWLAQRQHGFPHADLWRFPPMLSFVKYGLRFRSRQRQELIDDSRVLILARPLWPRSCACTYSFKVLAANLNFSMDLSDYVNADGMHVTSPSTPMTARCSGPYMWHFLSSFFLNLAPSAPPACHL